MRRAARLLVPAALVLSAPALAQTPAPAADFATGAVACAGALGPASLDTAGLKRDGWTVDQTRGAFGSYRRTGVGVRLIMSGGGGGSGQCVVDGWASDAGQFAAIRDAIAAALTTRFGAAPTMPAPPTPFGQAFVVGRDLILILSLDRRPAGASIRITGMRLPKR